jgi:hypothetical protein
MVGLVSLVGCAHAVNVDRISHVKTAAIIAYNGEVDIRDDRPEAQGSSISGALSGIQGLSDVASDETQARRVAEGQKTYDALVDKLSRGMGWSVLSRDQVTSNPAVQKLFAEKMKDLSVNKGFRFGVDKILWSEMGDLSQEQQAELKKALGVDALLVVRVQVKQGKLWGVGVNQDGVWDVYPKGILSFSAYDGGEGGAIWNERWVEGANTQGSLKRVMGVNETANEQALVVEATQLAADALVAKYAALKAPPTPSNM